MAGRKRIDYDTGVSIIKYHSRRCKVALIAKKLKLKWVSVKSIINLYENKRQIAPMKSFGRHRKPTTYEDEIVINRALTDRQIPRFVLGTVMSYLQCWRENQNGFP